MSLHHSLRCSLEDWISEVVNTAGVASSDELVNVTPLEHSSSSVLLVCNLWNGDGRFHNLVLVSRPHMLLEVKMLTCHFMTTPLFCIFQENKSQGA